MYITTKEYVDYLINNIKLLNQERNEREHEFEERFRILDVEIQSTVETLEKHESILSSGLIATDTILELSEKCEKYRNTKIIEYNSLREEYDEYMLNFIDKISDEIVLTAMIIENHFAEELNGLEIIDKLIDLIG